MENRALTPKAVFDSAHEITDPIEREAYLDQVCGDAPDLRRRVEALLRAHEKAGSFLETPSLPEDVTGPYQPETDGPGGQHPTTAEPLPGHDPRLTQPEPAAGPGQDGDDRQASEQPGTHVGPYRLARRIGQGGMGSVYLAEQEHPVRRQVALKIIKPGLDSGGIVARFEAERQALAMMDHLNIAKVLDAGATDNGWPYFVMELVQGVSLTRYCDDHRLTIRERLQLFVPICQAIQHAHQKGIIHRDIKPSNILVSVYDGKPVPKVIDFGIAKAIQQPLTSSQQATQIGTLVGTLDYMSPEQADLDVLDIDTRSDVYSLGVVLYELLTGSTPLERSKRGQLTLTEVLRLIKEEETPRPSARVAAAGASIAAQRSTEPGKLAKVLRGDLDWILLKGLAKDRTQRYETAAGLAKDVQRYLADEPVEACPPSTGYVLRKFARKHRTLLATASAFALLLLLGIVGLVVGIVMINHARQQTESALFSMTQAQEKTSVALDTTDAAIQAMLRGQVELGDKEKNDLRQVLLGYEEIANASGDSQESRKATAKAQFNRANLFALIKEPADAEAAYRRASQLYEQLAADFPLVREHRIELARCQFNLGFLLGDRKNYPEAEQAYRRAIELHGALVRAFLDEPVFQRDLADDWNNLGAVLSEQGRPQEAEAAYRQAISMGEALIRQFGVTPDFQVNLAASYHNLGNALRDQGKPADALPLYEQKVKLVEAIAAQDRWAATARLFLRNTHWDRANALGQLGRHEDAIKDWQRAIDLDDGTERDALRLFQKTAKAEVDLKAKPSAGQYFMTAVGYAQAAAAAAPVDPGLHRQYASRAVACLEQARDKGIFKDTRELEGLKHAVFNVLRDRPDFKKFEAELRGTHNP
jgi:serine/threonine protein kinase/Tfp pilus assembly protein PilF